MTRENRTTTKQACGEYNGGKQKLGLGLGLVEVPTADKTRTYQFVRSWDDQQASGVPPIMLVLYIVVVGIRDRLVGMV